jgi:hypothetical protein
MCQPCSIDTAEPHCFLLAPCLVSADTAGRMHIPRLLPYGGGVALTPVNTRTTHAHTSNARTSLPICNDCPQQQRVSHSASRGLPAWDTIAGAEMPLLA